MRSASNPRYHRNQTKSLVFFKMLNPGAADRLHHTRAVWQEQSDIEVIDRDYFALIVRPAEVRRLAR